MKVHGLDLDNSPLISQDKALRYAENIAIGEGNQSYINEDGFELKLDIVDAIDEFLDYGFDKNCKFHIIGTIPTNIGVVLFCVFYRYDDVNNENTLRSSLECIVYIKTNSNDPTIEKILYTHTIPTETASLNFSINRPIHGDYIYNYKNELIVTFTEGISEDANETRVININNPDGGRYEHLDGDEDDNQTKYRIYNISNLNLIPNVEYPTLNIEVDEGGNLRTGAYQIAIAYKLKDNSYTNYSILSVPVIICGKYGEDIKPDIEINRKIIVDFNEPINNNFTHYKLAIVHCTDTTQNCYETEDIKIENTSQSYIISNLINYDTIVLDDIFIKNISYIKEQTLVNYNNRLIRGNVQTLNYKDLNTKLINISENISLKFKPSLINPGDTYRYFKIDEQYVIYIGFFDRKGDLINIYPIKNIKDDDSYTKHLIKDDIYSISPKDSYKYMFNWISSDKTQVINNYIIDTFEDRNGLYSKKYASLPDGITNTNITCTINKIKNTRNNKLYIPISLAFRPSNINITTDLKEAGVFDNIDIQETILSVYVKNNNQWDEYYKETFDYTKYEKGITYTTFNNFLSTDFRGCTLEIEPGEECSWYITIHHKYKGDTINSIGDTHSYYTSESMKSAIGQELICNIDNVDIPEEIKSIAYFYIEHDKYNSKTLSQGLVFPDTNVNNFNTTVQQYEGQFEGANALRFYPFEFLFSQNSKLNGSIKPKFHLRGENNFTQNNSENNFNFERSYCVLIPKDNSDIDNESTIDTKGIKIYDTAFNQIVIPAKNSNAVKSILKDVKLEYISADNTSLQNIAGDSFYRIINKTIDDLPKYNNRQRIWIADLLNPSAVLYDNLNNQKLQIASKIHKPTDKDVILTGDTYVSYLTLRLTTPSKDYAYGLNDKPGKDSNNTVYRWILTFPIESKFNLTARYGGNIINKPFFLHYANLTQYKELLGLSYKVDNFINTDVGKGYNPVYNENGVEDFEYYNEIPETYNHPYRIIRSLAQSAESVKLNWRTYKTDDYKDMPFNRGEIISLKTDNKNLYIQQKYGLHLLQQRDQLNNDDANNSYLGTSDLFNMEPKEIVYSPSGYIGCESYFDTDVNVAGYVVIDAIHKKIFLINGDKPLEISNIKTREYFEKLIDANLINPYNKQGRIINYNEDRNILYITQINNNDTDSKTMSFSPLNKSWVSFHTYIPDLGFVNRNGLFWGKNGILYQPNSTIKGKYFGTTAEPSIIQFILNENTIYNKLLKTIVWKDQVSYKGDDYIQHFFKETINYIMVHNFDQCSGKLNVAFNESKEWWNGDTGTNKINLWRFNKLFDLVKPDNTSLFMKDAITPDTNKLKVDYKWYDVNRFICQFIYLTMWCNNTPINDKYHEWELIDVHPEWQLDNRNDQTYTTKENNQ